MPAYALEPHSRLDERSVWTADGMPPERRVPSAPGWHDAAGRSVEAAEDPDAAAAEVADFQLHVMSVLLQKGPWRLQQRQADAEALGRRILVRWRQLEAWFALRMLREHRQKRAISRLGRQALQPNRRLRMRAALETLHEYSAIALRTEPPVARLRRRLLLRRGVAKLLAEAARGRAQSLLDAPAAPLLASRTLRARSARRRTALASWARVAAARRATAASWEVAAAAWGAAAALRALRDWMWHAACAARGAAAAAGRARRLGLGLAALRAHAAHGAARTNGAAALARRRRRLGVDALGAEARRRREWRWAVKVSSDARVLGALRALAAAARAPAIARARMAGWVRGICLRAALLAWRRWADLSSGLGRRVGRSAHGLHRHRRRQASEALALWRACAAAASARAARAAPGAARARACTLRGTAAAWAAWAAVRAATARRVRMAAEVARLADLASYWRAWRGGAARRSGTSPGGAMRRWRTLVDGGDYAGRLLRNVDGQEWGGAGAGAVAAARWHGGARAAQVAAEVEAAIEAVEVAEAAEAVRTPGGRASGSGGRVVKFDSPEAMWREVEAVEAAAEAAEAAEAAAAAAVGAEAEAEMETVAEAATAAPASWAGRRLSSASSSSFATVATADRTSLTRPASAAVLATPAAATDRALLTRSSSAAAFATPAFATPALPPQRGRGALRRALAAPGGWGLGATRGAWARWRRRGALLARFGCRYVALLQLVGIGMASRALRAWRKRAEARGSCDMRTRAAAGSHRVWAAVEAFLRWQRYRRQRGHRAEMARRRAAASVRVALRTWRRQRAVAAAMRKQLATGVLRLGWRRWARLRARRCCAAAALASRTQAGAVRALARWRAWGGARQAADARAATHARRQLVACAARWRRRAAFGALIATRTALTRAARCGSSEADGAAAPAAAAAARWRRRRALFGWRLTILERAPLRHAVARWAAMAAARLAERQEAAASCAFDDLRRRGALRRWAAAAARHEADTIDAGVAQGIAVMRQRRAWLGEAMEAWRGACFLARRLALRGHVARAEQRRRGLARGYQEWRVRAATLVALAARGATATRLCAQRPLRRWQRDVRATRTRHANEACTVAALAWRRALAGVAEWREAAAEVALRARRCGRAVVWIAERRREVACRQWRLWAAKERRLRHRYGGSGGGGGGGGGGGSGDTPMDVALRGGWRRWRRQQAALVAVGGAALARTWRQQCAACRAARRRHAVSTWRAAAAARQRSAALWVAAHVAAVRWAATRRLGAALAGWRQRAVVGRMAALAAIQGALRPVEGAWRAWGRAARGAHVRGALCAGRVLETQRALLVGWFRTCQEAQMSTLAMQVGVQRGDHARRSAALWRWQLVIETRRRMHLGRRMQREVNHLRHMLYLWRRTTAVFRAAGLARRKPRRSLDAITPLPPLEVRTRRAALRRWRLRAAALPRRLAHAAAAHGRRRRMHDRLDVWRGAAVARRALRLRLHPAAAGARRRALGLAMLQLLRHGTARAGAMRLCSAAAASGRLRACQLALERWRQLGLVPTAARCAARCAMRAALQVRPLGEGSGLESWSLPLPHPPPPSLTLLPPLTLPTLTSCPPSPSCPPSLPRFLPLSASRAATTHLEPPLLSLLQKASRAASTLVPCPSPSPSSLFSLTSPSPPALLSPSPVPSRERTPLPPLP